MRGIFVNENGGIPYAVAIVHGIKPYETRTRNMLRPLIGERVAIIRTRRGKNPLVVGYARIASAERRGAAWLDANRDKTLIPPGCEYDTPSRWCYAMVEAERCDPYPLPTDAVRHGRSWCEF